MKLIENADALYRDNGPLNTIQKGLPGPLAGYFEIDKSLMINDNSCLGGPHQIFYLMI